MSTWQASNLVTRMREVLEDARGTLRTITSGTFSGNLPPGLDVNEEARRALNLDGINVPTEARITSLKRSPASPPVIGNLALYAVEVEVRQVFAMDSGAKIVDATRDGLQGLAAEYGEVIAQAFTYPGNLTQTQTAKATGLVSGMFAYVDSAFEWKGQVNEAGGTLEARHRFKGTVRSAPAV